MSSPPPDQWPAPPPPPTGPPQGATQWGPRTTGPTRGGAAAKWVLGGLALLVVVVITVVATILVTQSPQTSGPPVTSTPPRTTASQVAVASADDRDPAGIILDDATCQQWSPISAAFAHVASNGWNDRDPTIPASDWPPALRSQYEAVATVLNESADRSSELARKTPHRVMRELYEQFIAYSREYAKRIRSYTPEANGFALVTVGLAATLTAVCDAVRSGAAGARSPLVPDAPPPSGSMAKADPDNPQRFLKDLNPVCSQWLNTAKQFGDDTAAWRSVDPNIPGNELDANQRAINASVMSVMEANAMETQLLGKQSSNPIWADIATLSAQYRRAYVSALTTYQPADNDLQIAASSAIGTVSEACRTVGA